jgi:hypothetical protein
MIKAFKVFSLQETYNTVLFGLRKQGEASRRSPNEGGGCKYRLEKKTESGFIKFLKCAAGLLVTRRQYSEDLEDQIICTYANLDPHRCDEKKIVLASIIHRNGHNLDLVRKLQMEHDRASHENWLADWELRMERLARESNLKYTPPTPKAPHVRKATQAT